MVEPSPPLRNQAIKPPLAWCFLPDIDGCLSYMRMCAPCDIAHVSCGFARFRTLFLYPKFLIFLIIISLSLWHSFCVSFCKRNHHEDKELSIHSMGACSHECSSRHAAARPEGYHCDGAAAVAIGAECPQYLSVCLLGLSVSSGQLSAFAFPLIFTLY